MAHLASFRKGWENENLGRFILSRFSFIANPSTVSDDIGSDYYCTVFQVIKKNRHKYLIPKNSFAVQLKSFDDVKNKHFKIDLTDKREYLENLEIPFFIGVVDQENLKLSLYSGEYFSQFISFKTPHKLLIELCERDIIIEDYFTELNPKEFILRFPKIVEMKANIRQDELSKSVVNILEICSLSLKNISSRKNCEYIFYQYGTNKVQINAGKDSANTFRDNFVKRLAECFFNLYWIYNNSQKDFKISEFIIYEEHYKNLKSMNYSGLDIVSKPYVELKKIISTNTKV